VKRKYASMDRREEPMIDPTIAIAAWVAVMAWTWESLWTLLPGPGVKSVEGPVQV
jgi:hypothetical protein